ADVSRRAVPARTRPFLMKSLRSSSLSMALPSFHEKAAELGGKGLDAGLRAAEDEGVDVVRAFVGIDHLEVDDVADDAELVGDAVAAQHVAREARDLQRLAARVALHDRGDLDRRAALVLHAPEAQAALQAEGDLGLHVGELL